MGTVFMGRGDLWDEATSRVVCAVDEAEVRLMRQKGREAVEEEMGI